MSHPAWQTLQQLQAPPFFKQQYHTEVEPPQHEIPAGPMPDPSKQPDDENVAHLNPKSPTIAAQRDVYVGAKPTAQGDMPSPPKIGDALRAIRRIEVLLESEAEHEAEANRHVGIPAKVEVDLKSKSDDAKPSGEHGQRIRRRARYGVPEQSNVIGKQDFFRQPDNEAPDALREHLQIDRALVQLLGKRIVLNDGASYQLRKQGNISSEVKPIALRFCSTSIHVDDVGDRLKRVK